MTNGTKSLILVALMAVALLATVTAPFVARPAAATATTWAKSYDGPLDDWSKSVQPTADGGYVVLGETYSWGAGDRDLWVLKLDVMGAVEWQYAYGRAGDDTAHVILQTTDGGYTIAATTTDSSGFYGDAWILKLDATGEVQWQRAYGGTGSDEAFDIQQTSDGGYVFAGWSNSHRPGVEFFASVDAWVVKLDSAGSVVWQKAYGTSTIHECASSIQQTPDGGYIVAGTIWGTPSLWAFKLNSAGALSWQKVYGVGGGDVLCGGSASHFHAPNVLRAPDGGYLLVSTTNKPWSGFGQGDRDGWVVKVDSAGKVQWQKAYGTAVLEEFFSGEVTSDGGYIMAGTVRPSSGLDEAWLVRLNSAGTVQWQKTYAMATGPSHAWGQRSVHQTSDGGFVLAGHWSEGLFVMKLASNGYAGACVDPGIGADSSAVVTSTTAHASSSNAKATAPSTSTANTAAIPSATSASESQQCFG